MFKRLPANEDRIAPIGAVLPPEPGANFIFWSIPYQTAKWVRPTTSIAGCAIVLALIGYFLQLRGVVNLGLSRLVLAGIGCVTLLAFFSYVQNNKRRLLIVVGVIVALFFVDLFTPKPAEVVGQGSPRIPVQPAPNQLNLGDSSDGLVHLTPEGRSKLFYELCEQYRALHPELKITHNIFPNAVIPWMNDELAKRGVSGQFINNPPPPPGHHGINLKDSPNSTVSGGTIKGFKEGIYADNSPHLKANNVDIDSSGDGNGKIYMPCGLNTEKESKLKKNSTKQ
jgi:hypothetical protein